MAHFYFAWGSATPGLSPAAVPRPPTPLATLLPGPTLRWDGRSVTDAPSAASNPEARLPPTGFGVRAPCPAGASELTGTGHLPAAQQSPELSRAAARGSAPAPQGGAGGGLLPGAPKPGCGDRGRFCSWSTWGGKPATWTRQNQYPITGPLSQPVPCLSLPPFAKQPALHMGWKLCPGKTQKVNI